MYTTNLGINYAKKAEMGIGTLIIFISMLLIGTVATSVLIQTAGTMQEDALTSGSQTEEQISTSIRVVELSGSDGTDGDLEEFEKIIRLNPGSSSIQLDSLLFTINTVATSSILEYRGTTAVHEQDIANGYYTLAASETLATTTNTTATTLEEDYDFDGSADTVTLTANGHLNFTFSEGANLVVTDFNCTGTNHAISGSVAPTSNEIETISYSGTCGSDSTEGATIIITPVNIGLGYYTVEYLQRGTNPDDGTLGQGDIAKIHFETAAAINADEEFRSILVPEQGLPQTTRIITPIVVSTQRVYLYP